MDLPHTHTGKAERLRFCTQRVQLLAPRLLAWAATNCPSCETSALRALAARPPPDSLRELLTHAQTYETVELGMHTLAAALDVQPRAQLHAPGTVERSLWLFVLRFCATHSDCLRYPERFEHVEQLRDELADFLYMHCELDFAAAPVQDRRPSTVMAQREKVKLCKLHIKKLSAFLLGEPLPQTVFVERLARADPAFAAYVRLGVASLGQLLALRLVADPSREPAAALWEYLQNVRAPNARALEGALTSFLEFYSKIEQVDPVDGGLDGQSAQADSVRTATVWKTVPSDLNT